MPVTEFWLCTALAVQAAASQNMIWHLWQTKTSYTNSFKSAYSWFTLANDNHMPLIRYFAMCNLHDIWRYGNNFILLISHVYLHNFIWLEDSCKDFGRNEHLFF